MDENSEHTDPPPRTSVLFSPGPFSPVFHLALFFLFFFSVLRLGLTIVCTNYTHFTTFEIPRIFVVGFLYDIVFVSYAITPAILIVSILPKTCWRSRRIYRFISAAIFVAVCAFLFVLVSECVFWNEFQSRFNFIAVDYLVYTHELLHDIVESYPLPAILISIVVIAGAATYAYMKVAVRAFIFDYPSMTRWMTPPVFLVICLFFVGAVSQEMRGNIDDRYAQELSSNGPYQFFAEFRLNSLNYKRFYITEDDREMSERLKHMVTFGASSAPGGKGLYNLSRHTDAKPAAARLNVILVTVESLSAKYLTRFGCKADLTPRIDALARDSLVLTNFYATGTRTVRGLEALTLSIPPTPGRSVVKRRDIPVYYSIGHVLRQHGYDTAFIYGGRGYFDNMNAFFSRQGYRIIDQTDFAADEVSFSNAWGVCDEDLFARTIREADQEEGRPFFFHLMTTSNHRPYTFPEGRIDAPQKQRGSVVRYTDFAIGELIDHSRGKPWFKDTLFVIVADHCASSAGRAALNVIKHHIPCILYAPAHVAAREVDTLSCQIDIPPTLLALLGISYDAPFFGGNVLDSQFPPRALIGTYQNLGVLKGDRLLVLTPGRKCFVLTPPLERSTTAAPSTDDSLRQDAVALYQGTDYILRNGLYRPPLQDVAGKRRP